MDELLRETMSVNEAETYRHNVRLTLHFEDIQEGMPALDDDEFVDAPDTVDIEFDIDIDFRSWGIKDINVNFRGGLDFEIGVRSSLPGETKEEVIPIKVDFEETPPQILWVDGSGYTADEVHVTISGKEGYPVKSVEVDFYYLKP
jgi:hypothetical protein